MIIEKFNHIKHNINGKILLNLEISCLVNTNLSIEKVLDLTKYNHLIYDSYLEQCSEYLKGKPILFLCFISSKLVGFVLGFFPINCVTPYIPDITLNDGFYIASLFVLNKYQNNGIGIKLLEMIEDHCRNENYIKIYLNTYIVNDYIINFYKKRGFTILKKNNEMLTLYKINK